MKEKELISLVKKNIPDREKQRSEARLDALLYSPNLEAGLNAGTCQSTVSLTLFDQEAVNSQSSNTNVNSSEGRKSRVSISTHSNAF